MGLFLAIIFTSIAFPNFERVHWYRQIVLTIVTPPQKLATLSSNLVKNTWNHYIAITKASKENEVLKNALAKANQSLIELEEIRKENRNLHELLNMAHSIEAESVGANVIASNVLTEFKTLTTDKGHNDGIRKNMVVLGPGGLVGRIGQVGTDQSNVFLISDPNSAVDVYVERSGSRALLVGTSYDSSLRPFYSLSRLEYLRKTSDIRNGDVVITSGLDKLFPAGIPVGTIHNVENATTGLFKKAEVVPFVDLTEVKEVSIIKK